MRVPVATLLLCVSIVGVYFFLSQGAAYIPNQEFYNLAATTIKNAQTGVLSHLFIHVSLEHLVGNLVPLLIFGALLEFGVAGFDVFVIFFSSGLLTGAFFSFLNPGTPLAGASAAISGVMGAALSLSPRKALVLLIAVPLSLSFLFIPAVNLASEQAKIQTQKQIIEKEVQVTQLVKLNRTIEAKRVSQDVAILKQREKVNVEGSSREKEAQTSFAVHLFGAVVGVGYLFLFRRKFFEKGIDDFEKLGEQLFFLREKILQEVKRFKK